MRPSDTKLFACKQCMVDYDYTLIIILSNLLGDHYSAMFKIGFLSVTAYCKHEPTIVLTFHCDVITDLVSERPALPVPQELTS